MLVRRILHRAGFRYRIHPKRVGGHPDFVLPRFRLAVFVHGCFWHGHDCRLNHTPKSNLSYWTEKIKRNKERDPINLQLAEADGWLPIVIYECEASERAVALVRKLKTDKEC
jgi:DNA mismatch endonuclease (patch repair protein)